MISLLYGAKGELPEQIIMEPGALSIGAIDDRCGGMEVDLGCWSVSVGENAFCFSDGANVIRATSVELHGSELVLQTGEVITMPKDKLAGFVEWAVSVQASLDSDVT